MKLTAVFEKVPEGYIGFVEELPGANVQERTLDEAKQSLREVVLLINDFLARKICRDLGIPTPD
jgi:predicted RNase H-like HicB family nuclease